MPVDGYRRLIAKLSQLIGDKIITGPSRFRENEKKNEHCTSIMLETFAKEGNMFLTDDSR